MFSPQQSFTLSPKETSYVCFFSFFGIPYDWVKNNKTIFAPRSLMDPMCGKTLKMRSLSFYQICVPISLELKKFNINQEHSILSLGSTSILQTMFDLAQEFRTLVISGDPFVYVLILFFV